MSIVWEEEPVVFMRDHVRIEHTAFRVVGGQNKVVEAVQDEARRSNRLPNEQPEQNEMKALL
jgi:hypothetical protein